MNTLRLLYADQGRLANAEAMYQRSVVGYENPLGTATTTHIPYLSTLENYALLCEATRGLLDATSCHGNALSGIDVVFGTDSKRYASISRRIQKISDSEGKR